MIEGRDKRGRFAKGSKINQGRLPSFEQRRKQSDAMRGRTETVEHKAKIRDGLLRAAQKGRAIGRPKGGIPWNKGMKRVNGDPIPNYTPLSENGRKKLSRIMATRMKEAWKDPAFAKKCLVFNSPNKSEQKLMGILDSLYPGEWKFVGDGQVIIDRKCPDFINVNGQKKIIELYGERWHQNDDPRDREVAFAPFGYRTLVVWTRELCGIKKLTRKLNDFMMQES